MDIKFLGTGGAFEPQYYNSAAIINFKGQKILIDAGFTVYPRLLDLGLLHAIDYILLTHLHNDHSGSLSNILLHKYYFNAHQQSKILYPTENFKQQLHDFLALQLKEPDQFAHFLPIDSLPGISALDTFGRHSEGFQSYSYILEEAGERLVYSGDLRDTDYLFEHLQSLPPRPTTVFHDITFKPGNEGHAHYTMVQPYQQQYQILGYHCNPTQNPPDNTIELVYDQPHLRYDL